METGDRVICIDASTHGDCDISPPLTKGREYIVYESHHCDCGDIYFDVGLISKLGFMECSNCTANSFTHKTKEHWCNSKRFAKVKEQYRIIHMDIEIEEPTLN